MTGPKPSAVPVSVAHFAAESPTAKRENPAAPMIITTAIRMNLATISNPSAYE
jgi:hypothetical protein